MNYNGKEDLYVSHFLQHWKYIKRERKGDKWVYTYPEDKKSDGSKKQLTTTKSFDSPNGVVKGKLGDLKKKIDEEEMYDKTPLGKIDKAVESGKDFLENLFKKKKK